MRHYMMMSLILSLVLVLPALCQPLSSDSQTMIAEQETLFRRLSALLDTTVDSCNQALIQAQHVFEFSPNLLVAHTIEKAVAPGDVPLTPPFDQNDVLLLLDRLKMRNSSVNQIVHIVSDETSYIRFATKAYQTQTEKHQKEMELAEKRFKETESWGRRNLWRGIVYGGIGGGLLGLLVGIIIS